MDNVLNLKDFLSNKMPKLFLSSEIEFVISNLIKEGRYSKYICDKYLTTHINKLALNWNLRAEFKLLTLQNANDISVSDIIEHLSKKYYQSHYSALYFNKLTNQSPSSYFFSREYKNRTAVHSNDFVPLRIKQAFIKPARETSRFFTFNNKSFYLINKQNIDDLGLINSLNTLISGPERTFIECIMSPHYAGGINNIIESYTNVNLNLKLLFDVYESYSPYYPYWQSIGFIIDRTKNTDLSQKWRSKFAHKKMIDFYLDKNFRSDWKFDPNWRIFYSKGIF